MYNSSNSIEIEASSPYQNYTRYKSPDPILLLSDNLKPQYIPGFNVDTSSFFNLSNYYTRGIRNSLIIIILLICVLGILYSFVMSF